MTDPVEDLTLTQTGSTAIGTLEWTHPTPGTVDRFMLGFKIGDVWTNLEPRPKSDFGAGPYEATVLIRSDITWRVLALDADGVIS